MKSNSYPENIDKNVYSILYYVEFNRGGKENTFTLFQRNWIMDKEKYKKDMEKMDKESFIFSLMSNEGHPYQLFGGFCKESCFPSPDWVRYMVDQLNNGVKN